MKYVVNVRGNLKGSPEQAQKAHDAIIAKISSMSRQMGNTSHQTFLNVQNKNEFFALDFWDNLEAIQKLYSDPALMVEFATLFEGQPQVTIWAESGFMQY